MGQDDRRKAVLSSAAARFSLDIFIAFNNFLCFVTISHLAKALTAFQALQLAVHMSPPCVTTYMRL